MGFTGRVLRRGAEKGVSRGCLERPLGEYAPLDVRPCNIINTNPFKNLSTLVWTVIFPQSRIIVHRKLHLHYSQNKLHCEMVLGNKACIASLRAWEKADFGLEARNRKKVAEKLFWAHRENRSKIAQKQEKLPKNRFSVYFPHFGAFFSPFSAEAKIDFRHFFRFWAGGPKSASSQAGELARLVRHWHLRIARSAFTAVSS